ncbi:MAG TPA: hypothetical protein VM143_01415 [Acidimicrobiales bacterium]|nr:hypothetical protein [Acidimicrobiales bacterium]
MTALIVCDWPYVVGQKRPKDIEAPQVAEVAVDQNDRYSLAAVIAHSESDAAGVDEQVLSHALRRSSCDPRRGAHWL